MEKICIVKRRKPSQESIVSPETETGGYDRSAMLSIQLTPQQTESIRSNEYFQHLHTTTTAPIFLNLHFAETLPQKLLKASEICQVLQVSKNTLRKLLKDGAVKSYKIGRLRRFTAEDVMEYLAENFGLSKLRTIQVDVDQRPTIELETSST